MAIPHDPRLADVVFLAVAARRAKAKRQASGGLPPDWEQGVGLASLLEAGRALPQRGQGPTGTHLPDLEPQGGLARMLAEARQWQQEVDGGA